MDHRLMDHQDELRAAGRLTGRTLGGIVGVVRDIHHAVLARVDTVLPAPARAVVAVNRQVSRAVYAGVTVAHEAAPALGGEVAARTWSADGPAPSRSRWGRVVLPTVHGLWGDTIAAREPALAAPMAIRVAGHDVSMDPAAITDAFPDATGHLVVFLHGLCESDESWWRGDDVDPVQSYGDLLRDDLGLTPVYVAYNSGLRVSDNGRSLANLLAGLFEAWPVPVQDITLIGHSMGGLVARSACHQGASADLAWTGFVGTVVTLGTPHLGAPLEKIVHVADRLLSRFPETEPLARLMNGRSVGVKDLRYGAVVEADWSGHDPDEFLRDRCTEVPFLERATHYWVAASITQDASHVAARLLGDGMVRHPSATGAGRGRRLPFEPGNGAHVTGVGHLALLNHPDVYERLKAWLSARRPVSSPVLATPGRRPPTSTPSSAP